MNNYEELTGAGDFCGSASNVPAQPVGGDPAVEVAAHAIHEAYCKHFVNVTYAAFRDCWLKAAVLVQLFEVDPQGFVVAQKSRNTSLDPEDLTADEALSAYRRIDSAVTKDLILGFVNSEREYRHDVKRMGKDPASVLYALLLSYDPAFRVVYAKMNFTAEEATHIIEHHGEAAAKEIRSSKGFRQYILQRFPALDMDTFLQELDRVSGPFWANLDARKGTS